MTKEKNYKINEEEVIKMLKERKEDKQINEEEAIRVFLMFRSFPTDKQAFAIAFINGMEFQKKLDGTESNYNLAKQLV